MPLKQISANTGSVRDGCWLNKPCLWIPALIACGGLLGVATQKPIFGSWIPGAVSMKSTSAWLIIAHAFVGFLLCDAVTGKSIRSAVHFVVALNFFLIAEVVREIVAYEGWNHDPAKSLFPAAVTMFTFSLLSVRALLALHGPNRVVRVFSLLIAGIGLSIILGYALRIPVLYFYIPEWRLTAVALSTGTAFFLFGLLDLKNFSRHD